MGLRKCVTPALTKETVNREFFMNYRSLEKYRSFKILSLTTLIFLLFTSNSFANSPNTFRSCSMDSYVKNDALDSAKNFKDSKLHTLYKGQNEVGYFLTVFDSYSQHTLVYYMWICSSFSKIQFSVEKSGFNLINWIPGSNSSKKVTLSRSLIDDEAIGKMHISQVSKSFDTTTLSIDMFIGSLANTGESFRDSALVVIPNSILK